MQQGKKEILRNKKPQQKQKPSNKYSIGALFTMFGNNIFTQVKRSENKKMAAIPSPVTTV